MQRKMLLVLGGIWHDFEGFAAAVQPLFAQKGWEIETTYDLNRLLNLEKEHLDLVMSYTCLGKHREGYNDSGPERMEAEQVWALSHWVQRGGNLFAMHSATVLAGSDPELGRLIGGEFVSHPPAFSFMVYPVSRPHPMIENVPAFSVFDEFYVQKLVDTVDVHMWAIDRGVAHPMVWTKHEGNGKVAHIAMGHGLDVWSLPHYQRLISQGVDWLVA